MHPPEQALALEDGLGPPRLPVNARLHNLIASRTVLLGDLLGVALPKRVRLRHGGAGVVVLRMIIEGEDAAVAQVGIPAELLQALGVSQDLSLPLLSAVAEQMLSPLLPALRQLFEQDICVRLERAADPSPDTYGWAKFLLWPEALAIGLPCRVREVFSQKLVDLASGLPRRGHDETRIPLFLGMQPRLAPHQLRGLQVGDVIVVGDAWAGRLDLRVDNWAPPHASPRLAVVSRREGCIEHLSPGAWHEQPHPSGASGRAVVGINIVVGRMTLRACQCRQLALGQRVAGWDEVAWLGEAQLLLCGRSVGSARAVRVAGVPGYEVTAIHRRQAHDKQQLKSV